MDSVYSLKKNKIRRINYSKGRETDVESFLYYKGQKRSNFLINGNKFDLSNKDLRLRTSNKFLDGINKKALNDYAQFVGKEDKSLFIKYKTIIGKLNKCQDDFSERGKDLMSQISIVRLWNTSILVAVVIGMISMSFIYRYLGQGVSAKDEALNKQVAGVSVESKDNKKLSKEEEEKYINDLAEYLELEADKDFNKKVKELVKGYPIEEFLPYLLDQDHKVVAFYIAIAKKESNWGKRVPVLNGKDCYNYVGYRGKSEKTGSGGHTCFANRKEAVNVVSKRIEELIEKYGRDTAKEMVVWKCGSSCAATGGQAAANKWISDVDGILEKLKK